MSAAAFQEPAVIKHRVFRALLLAMAYPGRAQANPLGSASARAALDALIASVWESPADVTLVEGICPAELFERLPRGSEEAPQDGATIIVLTTAQTIQTAVDLHGPGIDGCSTAKLPLSHAALAARNAACATFPCGIDCIFVSADGDISALPRTTRVRMR